MAEWSPAQVSAGSGGGSAASPAPTPNGGEAPREGGRLGLAAPGVARGLRPSLEVPGAPTRPGLRGAPCEAAAVNGQEPGSSLRGPPEPLKAALAGVAHSASGPGACLEAGPLPSNAAGFPHWWPNVLGAAEPDAG